MKSKKACLTSLVAIGFAICILVQTPALNAQQPVTRPLHIQGQSTGLMDLFPFDLPWTELEQGVASEIGKFVSVGKYSAYAPNALAFGILFAANGDQIHWEYSGGVTSLTGGTGRFEGVTGTWTFTEVSAYDYASDPSGRLIIRYTWKAEGTITY